MSIIAVYNIKGGVGKTATSVNLSYLSCSQGMHTLLCDMDPQGSSSYYFRIRPKKKYNRNKFLQGGEHIDKNIRGTDYEGLDMLPSDFSYRNLDIALDDLKVARTGIKRVLEPLTEEYDHIFLDCPPNLTLLSENMFFAADCVLVPVIPTTLSLLSLKQLMKFFDDTGLDKSKLLFFFSMVERRKKLHTELMDAMQGKAGLLEATIPYLADIEKMGLDRKPVTAARPNSAATLAYTRLWEEVTAFLHNK